MSNPKALNKFCEELHEDLKNAYKNKVNIHDWLFNQFIMYCSRWYAIECKLEGSDNNE